MSDGLSEERSNGEENTNDKGTCDQIIGAAEKGNEYEFETNEVKKFNRIATNSDKFLKEFEEINNFQLPGKHDYLIKAKKNITLEKNVKVKIYDFTGKNS